MKRGHAMDSSSCTADGRIFSSGFPGMLIPAVKASAKTVWSMVAWSAETRWSTVSTF